MKLHPSTARTLLAVPTSILSLMLTPGLCLADSDSGWMLRDEGETHALYTRERAGSEYDEYRLEVRFEAEPDAVLAALEHNMLDPTALPATMRRTVLRREDQALVSHDYIDVPFLADRDAVVRTEFARNVEPGVHVVRWRSVEGEGPEASEGVVRMPSSTGSWTLSPGASGGTHAIYESHVELGGSLPSSLVESQTTREIVQQVDVIRRTLRERELAQR
jgi:hypothetical protein